MMRITYNILHPTVSCDRFSAATYTVTIVSGTTSAVLPIEIADDGIYEGDESFTLEILNSLQNLVTLGRISTATVVIEEDEDSKMELVVLFEYSVLFIHINNYATYVCTYLCNVGGSN